MLSEVLQVQRPVGLPDWQERKQATSPRGLMACLVFDCGRAFRLPAHEKPAPDSTRALFFDDLESGYAAFRRRHQPTPMPRAPSSDQMMRVAGSGTVLPADAAVEPSVDPVVSP